MADVLIEDDRIAEPYGRRVDAEIDGAGKTLLPGLIDAHTHTFDGSLARALAHGVTTELDMFCLPANLARQRSLAAEREDVADLRSLTNEEALAAATSVPARHFGLSGRGRVAPGMRANLLLVQGDPTHDSGAVAHIVHVWRRGARLH